MIVQESHNASSYAESKVMTIVIVCIVFAAISLGMLLLRLYIRFRVLKASGLDDWTMLIAQVLHPQEASRKAARKRLTTNKL